MNIVVTGGTDGIGLALVKKLLSLGHNVQMIGKDSKKAEKILNNISNKNLEFFECDLSEKEEVDKLIIKMNNLGSIDVLVNNAGAIFNKRELNSKGVEKTFALNHLSYLQLSLGLKKKLEESKISRIVNISSNVHKYYGLDINDLQNEINYNGWKAYCRSKLMNILITYSFKKELNTKINCNCLHPGFVNSNFGNNNKTFLRLFIKLFKNLFAISNEKASLSPLYIATSENLNGVNAKYFDKIKEIRSSKQSYDSNLRKLVWEESLKYLQ
tara:strand:+ start:2474 stop:3283 length:810 start_codon:yes stop_codon:yes gene_type:complete